MPSFSCYLWAKFCGFHGAKMYNIFKTALQFSPVGRALASQPSDPGSKPEGGIFNEIRPSPIRHLPSILAVLGAPRFAKVVEIDGGARRNTA